MKPLCIAHRGRHKEFFENTLGAFKVAAEGKYYGIETDIHLTKDNKWIVHHDADFLTNGKKVVIKEELASDLVKMPLDNNFGIKDAYCPMFDEYLQTCKDGGKRPIIEIKPSNVKRKYLKEMVAIIKKYFDIKDVTVIAFHPWPLIKLRKMLGSKIHLQHLMADQHLNLVYKIAKRYKMDIDINYNFVTKQMIDEVHSRGAKVNIWTVDDKETLKTWIDNGADYITTNEFNQED